jgi:hypothetical protein
MRLCPPTRVVLIRFLGYVMSGVDARTSCTEGIGTDVPVHACTDALGRGQGECRGIATAAETRKP